MDAELMLDVGQANELKLAFRRSGWTSADVKKLSEGDIAIQLLPVIRGLAKIVPVEIFRKVATVVVNGTEKFVAKDHLKEANVGWTSDNFKKLFLDKAEEGVKAATIVVHRLERDSLDAPILTELGSHVETKLAHFFELLKTQSKGESDTLLTNGYANIAYIKGNDGNFWAVRAYWYSGLGYWHVRANSVDYPYRWPAGSLVLSCDS